MCITVSISANSYKACALVGVGSGGAQPVGQSAGIGGCRDEYSGRSPQLTCALAQSDSCRLEQVRLEAILKFSSVMTM